MSGIDHCQIEVCIRVIGLEINCFEQLFFSGLEIAFSAVGVSKEIMELRIFWFNGDCLGQEADCIVQFV